MHQEGRRRAENAHPTIGGTTSTNVAACRCRARQRASQISLRSLRSSCRRAVAQSRKGAVCETALGQPHSLHTRIAIRMRPFDERAKTVGNHNGDYRQGSVATTKTNI
jgi:hypothetical protein